MYRREYPTFAMPPSVPLRPLGGPSRRTGWQLSDVRSEWVNRSVGISPTGQGPQAMLLLQFGQQTAWLPVGLRTLGELCRSVGGEMGELAGGGAMVVLSRPVSIRKLAEWEPATMAAIYREMDRSDGHLGGFFSDIGGSLSSVVGAARDAVDQAVEAARDAASKATELAQSAAAAANQAVSQATEAARVAAEQTAEATRVAAEQTSINVSHANEFIDEHKKDIICAGLIVGGVVVIVGTGGAATPVGMAMIGAGVGIATQPGGDMGKFKEWAPRAAVGAVAGYAVGLAAVWVMEGGLTQVGATLFSTGTGAEVATVGTETTATTATATAAVGGTSVWSAIPVGALVKIGASYVMKTQSGGAAPASFAPGSSPTSPGMTVLPRAATGAAPAEEAATNTPLIAGVAVAAALVLGMGR